MTKWEAIQLITAKYPKTKIEEIQVDIDEVCITVWEDNGDKNFFDFEGNHIGFKQY